MSCPHAVAISAPRYGGPRPVLPGESGWPAGLDALGHDAPERLWVRGEPLTLTSPVAIVGSRASTAYGEQIAANLASGLAEAGVTVLTGGAYGIEAAATRGARAVGGSVVVVLAGGVDVTYPRAHTDLFAEVLRRGSLVSAYEPGTPPTRARFVERSHLIAAMSAAVVVVEAGPRSGALATVGHAHELGRPVLAVPGPVTSATSQAPHQLIRDSVAHLVTNTQDVLDVLATTPEGDPAHV